MCHDATDQVRCATYKRGENDVPVCAQTGDCDRQLNAREDLSSGGVQHEGFIEMKENGDKSADISCDDDLEREEITAALADAESQADTCMLEEEETEIADGDTRLDNKKNQAPALNLGELLRAQKVDVVRDMSREGSVLTRISVPDMRISLRDVLDVSTYAELAKKFYSESHML
jgi:hypothetical protein